MPLIEPDRKTLFDLHAKCNTTLFLAVALTDSQNLNGLSDQATEEAAKWVKRFYDLCKYKYPEELQEASFEIDTALKSQGRERIEALCNCNDCFYEVYEHIIREDCMADANLEHEEYCGLCRMVIDIYNAALLYNKYVEAFNLENSINERCQKFDQILKMAAAMKQEHMLPEGLQQIYCDAALNSTTIDPLPQFEQLKEYIYKTMAVLNEESCDREFDLIRLVLLLSEIQGITSLTFDEASELFYVSFAKGWEKKALEELSENEEIEIIPSADSSDIMINAWPKRTPLQTLYQFAIAGVDIDSEDPSPEKDELIDALIESLKQFKQEAMADTEAEQAPEEEKPGIEDIHELFSPCEYEENGLSEILLDGLVSCAANPDSESESPESPLCFDPAFTESIYKAMQGSVYENYTAAKEEKGRDMPYKNIYKIIDIDHDEGEDCAQLIFKREQSIFISGIDGKPLQDLIDKVSEDITEYNETYYFAILDKHEKNLLKKALKLHADNINFKPCDSTEDHFGLKSQLTDVTFKVVKDKETDSFLIDNDKLSLKAELDDACKPDIPIFSDGEIRFEIEDKSRSLLEEAFKDTKAQVEDFKCHASDWEDSSNPFDPLIDLARNGKPDTNKVINDLAGGLERLVDEQHEVIMKQDAEIANLKAIINSYEELKALLDDHDLIAENEADSDEESAACDIQVISGDEYRSLLKESGKVELLKEQIEQLAASRKDDAEPTKTARDYEEIIENQNCLIADLTDQVNDYREQYEIATHSLLDQEIKLTEANQGLEHAQLLLECIQNAEDAKKAKAAESDPINPDYYKKAGLECIDVMKEFMLEDEMFGFCRGNAFKYLWRAGGKEGNSAEQDYQKARWYLEKMKEF